MVVILTPIVLMVVGIPGYIYIYINLSLLTKWAPSSYKWSRGAPMAENK